MSINVPQNEGEDTISNGVVHERIVSMDHLEERRMKSNV